MVFCEEEFILGTISGTKDDDISIAKCSSGTVLVNCDMAVESDGHDGFLIQDGNCLAQNGVDGNSVQVLLAP